MAEVDHKQVMLGVLRMTKALYATKKDMTISVEHSKPLRGILFALEPETQNPELGMDLLNPGISHPTSIIPVENYYEEPVIRFHHQGGIGPTKDDFWDICLRTKFEICNYVSLSPLLEHLGLTGSLSTADFESLRDEVLTNKKWLLENKELFGWVLLGYSRFPNSKFILQTLPQVLPLEIAEMMIDIYQNTGRGRRLALTRQERKHLKIG